MIELICICESCGHSMTLETNDCVEVCEVCCARCGDYMRFAVNKKSDNL